MGRPIKKKYFGNTNTPPVGGEGVLSVSLTSGGTGYSRGTVATFGAPQLAGGTTATVALTINGSGTITTVTPVVTGGGYTSAPSLTITKATTVNRAATGSNLGTTLTLASTTGIYVGMQVTGSAGLGTGNGANSVLVASVDSDTQVTVVTPHDGAVSATLAFTDIGASATVNTVTMTTSKQNALTISAYVVGGSSAVVGDIIKQEASRRYLVRTAQGTSQCKLVAAAPSAGEMTFIARDSDTNEYYVTKLTAHRALLTRKAINGSAYEFATGASVPWNLTAAVLNTSVKLDNA